MSNSIKMMSECIAPLEDEGISSLNHDELPPYSTGVYPNIGQLESETQSVDTQGFIIERDQDTTFSGSYYGTSSSSGKQAQVKNSSTGESDVSADYRKKSISYSQEIEKTIYKISTDTSDFVNKLTEMYGGHLERAKPERHGDRWLVPRQPEQIGYRG